AAQLRRHAADPHRRRHPRPRRGGSGALCARREAGDGDALLHPVALRPGSDQRTPAAGPRRFCADAAGRGPPAAPRLTRAGACGAVVVGWLAYRAISERLEALRSAADEASRADRLEEAVRERTHELTDANERLRQEAAEREAAEAQLRQVQKMEAVGQLTGGIAHDFNNMLAVVVGGIDLALRRLNGPRREVMMHLNNAMEGATRAAALTRRLLSFARSEPLLPERVDGNELIGGMSDLLDRT